MTIQAVLDAEPEGRSISSTEQHLPIHSVLLHLLPGVAAVGRINGVLPLMYIVRWKRNLYLGMAAHILANSIDVLTAAAFILRMA